MTTWAPNHGEDDELVWQLFQAATLEAWHRWVLVEAERDIEACARRQATVLRAKWYEEIDEADR